MVIQSFFKACHHASFHSGPRIANTKYLCPRYVAELLCSSRTYEVRGADIVVVNTRYLQVDERHTLNGSKYLRRGLKTWHTPLRIILNHSEHKTLELGISPDVIPFSLLKMHFMVGKHHVQYVVRNPSNSKHPIGIGIVLRRHILLMLH